MVVSPTPQGVQNFPCLISVAGPVCLDGQRGPFRHWAFSSLDGFFFSFSRSCKVDSVSAMDMSPPPFPLSREQGVVPVYRFFDASAGGGPDRTSLFEPRRSLLRSRGSELSPPFPVFLSGAWSFFLKRSLDGAIFGLRAVTRVDGHTFFPSPLADP